MVKWVWPLQARQSPNTIKTNKNLIMVKIFINKSKSQVN